MATLHVLIEGRVQGVFFRDSTKRKADELGLAGWVRNLPDGRVEALFQGDRERCEEALRFVNTGPSAARVERVEHAWQSQTDRVSGFRIRW